MIDTTTPATAEFVLTAEQIARASRHLAVTREMLLESVAGLTPAQWDFKPDHASWSTSEILEHLTVIESRVHVIIRNLGTAPEAASAAGLCEMDELILSEVPKRTTRVKAPEPVQPEGRWAGLQALQAFLAGREQTMQLLSAPLLRGRVRPHPIFGYWDGYQWLLATASHTEQHVAQIRELHADREFPSY